MSDTVKALQRLKRRMMAEHKALRVDAEAAAASGRFLKAALSSERAAQWWLAAVMVDAEIRKAKP